MDGDIKKLNNTCKVQIDLDEQGVSTSAEIAERTGLSQGSVQMALHSLCRREIAKRVGGLVTGGGYKYELNEKPKVRRKGKPKSKTVEARALGKREVEYTRTLLTSPVGAALLERKIALLMTLRAYCEEKDRDLLLGIIGDYERLRVR